MCYKPAFSPLTAVTWSAEKDLLFKPWETPECAVKCLDIPNFLGLKLSHETNVLT